MYKEDTFFVMFRGGRAWRRAGESKVWRWVKIKWMSSTPYSPRCFRYAWGESISLYALWARDKVLRLKQADELYKMLVYHHISLSSLYYYIYTGPSMNYELMVVVVVRYYYRRLLGRLLLLLVVLNYRNFNPSVKYLTGTEHKLETRWGKLG